MQEFALQQTQKITKKLELKRKKRILELQKLEKNKKGQIKLKKELAGYQEKLVKKRYLVSKNQRVGLVNEEVTFFSRKKNVNQFAASFDLTKKELEKEIQGKQVLTVNDDRNILKKNLKNKILTTDFKVFNDQDEMNFKAQEFDEIFLPNFFPDWLEVDDLAEFLKDLLKSLKVKGRLRINSIDILNHPKFKQKKYNAQFSQRFQQLNLRFLELLGYLQEKHLISLSLHKPYLQNIKLEPDFVKDNLAPTVFVIKRLR